MSSRRLGYDATGNPGGVYNMSNPPVGKRFGSFVNGGKAIQWLEARPARQPYARSGSRPSSPPPATPVPSASNTGGNRTQNAAIDLLFQALDSDGDGVITKAELVAALSPRNSPRAGDPDSRPVSPLAQLPPTRAGQQPAHRSRPAYSSNSSSRRSSRPVSPAASGPYSTNSADREVDLYVAASMGGVDEVTRLIEGGADPNRPGLDGDTPLHAAAANGHGAVVAVLLQAGADTRSRVAGRKTALHVAAEHKHDTAVAALLTAGADPNAIDAAGETARDIAARKSHLVCVAIIDKHTGARQSRSSRGRVSRPTSRAVSPSESRTTSPGLSPRTLEQERVLMERDRLSRERDHANATLRAQNAEIAHMAEQVREGRTDGYISVQIGAPPAEQQARGTRTAPAMTGAAGAVQRTQQQKPRLVPAAPTVSDPEDPECSHPQFTRQQRPVDGMNVKLDLEGTRTHSMADQLDSKLVDMKIEPAIENHWEKEAEAIANMMDESTPKASTAAPKLKLNKEINLAKIVPRVVRLEQLGQHTSGCVDALRAEVADKQQVTARVPLATCLPTCCADFGSASCAVTDSGGCAAVDQRGDGGRSGARCPAQGPDARDRVLRNHLQLHPDRQHRQAVRAARAGPPQVVRHAGPAHRRDFGAGAAAGGRAQGASGPAGEQDHRRDGRTGWRRRRRRRPGPVQARHVRPGRGGLRELFQPGLADRSDSLPPGPLSLVMLVLSRSLCFSAARSPIEVRCGGTA